jgi:pyrroloquinoline quinone biosynthesis protein B
VRRRNFLGAFGGGLLWLESLQFSEKPPSFFEKRADDQSQDAADVIIKILGTAQDGGIPQLGCHCPNCSRARKDPGQARLISSLAILDFKEKQLFIVDATPDIRTQFDRACDRLYEQVSIKTKTPQGVLLTHAHIGHYTGLMFFGFESMAAQRLPVYCSLRMKDFLANNGPWSQLVKQDNISTVVLSPNDKLQLTSRISVIPFQVPHRDEYTDTLGLRISGSRKKILYIPDIQNWAAWERSVIEAVDEVDAALLDGTFYSPDELPGRDLSGIGHPFIKDSMDLLEKAARKGKTAIYFTHFNHSNQALDPDGEARKSILEKGFHVADEGLEIPI